MARAVKKQQQQPSTIFSWVQIKLNKFDFGISEREPLNHFPFMVASDKLIQCLATGLASFLKPFKEERFT